MNDEELDPQNNHEKALEMMANKSFNNDLLALLKSRAQIIYLTCNEEKRMKGYFKHLSGAYGYDVFFWDCCMGLIDILDKPVSTSDDITSPNVMLDKAIEQANKDVASLKNGKSSSTKGTIFVMLDFHRFMDDAVPDLERRLKNFFNIDSKTYLMLVGPHFVSTPALENIISVLDFPFPNPEEIHNTLWRLVGNVQEQGKLPNLAKDTKKREDQLVKAANGLTLNEVQMAFSKSLVIHKDFDIPTILKEKQQIIRKKGLLEFFEPKVSMADVGGLKNVVKWLERRKLAFTKDAEKYGLPNPKGIMLIGLPGCVLPGTKIGIKKLSNGEELEAGIEDFFKMCENDGGTYQIDTPQGWQNVGDLVKKTDKHCYHLSTENGLELDCSNDHYVLSEGGWKKSEDIQIGEKIHTKYGLNAISSKMYIGVHDTFDLEVLTEEHAYYSNGIVSHNTGKSLVAKAASTLYQLPLLRLDFGKLFNSLVGESENAAREVIKQCEAISPCITGDTKVNTNLYKNYEIKELYNHFIKMGIKEEIKDSGESIIVIPKNKTILISSYDKEENKESFIKMNALIRRPAKNKKLLKIILDNGNFIKVTENHKILVKDENENNFWKEAKELKENDIITCI